MSDKDMKLREIWAQQAIPIVFRPEEGPLLVRLPFEDNNKEWLRGDKRRKPKWDAKLKAWEVPVAWFDDMVEQLVEGYEKAFVIQLHRELQKCARACWEAEGLHCECSCMGANHGQGHPGGNWYEVSETFACQWGPKTYACRLIVPRQEPPRPKTTN